MLSFLNNVRYLFKYNLKEMYKCSVARMSEDELIEAVLYEIPDSNVFRPKIENNEKTVEKLVNTQLNLARFGDGEMTLMQGNGIPFQNYDEKLANRLKDILYNEQKNLLVGINYGYYYPFDVSQWNESAVKFLRTIVPKLRKKLSSLLNKDKAYYSASITQLYQLYKTYNFEGLFSSFRKIWDNKKIVLVSCKKALEDLQYNIFDNASEIRKEIVPAKNCFEFYDEILKNLTGYDKDYIIILMCGPTAKVLCSDLTKLEYRALDLGHIAKDYDWYKRDIPRAEDSCSNFFAPDV